MPYDDKKGIFTCENGVEIKVRKPSAVAVEGIQSRLTQDDPEPLPPMMFSEDKQRDEPNPNDPDYQSRLLGWSSRTGMRVTEVLLLTGTSAGKIPDDMYEPDSDELDSWLEALGLGLPDDASVHVRYLAWLKYYVATDTEFTELSTELVKLGGVTEEHIRQAEETFRSRVIGATNSSSPAE